MDYTYVEADVEEGANHHIITATYTYVSSMAAQLAGKYFKSIRSCCNGIIRYHASAFRMDIPCPYSVRVLNVGVCGKRFKLNLKSAKISFPLIGSHTHSFNRISANIREMEMQII